MADFSLSKLAAALKAVNDAGEALAKSCMDAKPNADGKVAADIEPLKKGLVDVWDCIAPREAAKDSPTQEVARGDGAKANDSRRVIDVRGLGASHPLAGLGPYIESGYADTRHSIDGIFNGDGQGSSPDNSIDAIFAKG